MAKIDSIIIEELALFAAKNANDGNIGETTKKLVANFHEAIAAIKEYEKQINRERKQSAKIDKTESKEAKKRKKQTEKVAKKAAKKTVKPEKKKEF